MSWRAVSEGDGVSSNVLGGLVLLCIAYVPFAAHFAFLIWAGAASILVAAAILERRFRIYPSMAYAPQIFTAPPAKVWNEEDRDRVRGLRELQTRYRREKHALYHLGDSQGVARRRDERFDERGVGKDLNAKIAHLEWKFEEAAHALCQLELKVVGHKQALSEEYWEWKRRHFFALAGRATLAAYIGSVVALIIICPEWLRIFQPSSSPGLTSYYGPLVISACTASATALGTWSIYRIRIPEFSPERPIGVCNLKIEEFVTPAPKLISDPLDEPESEPEDAVAGDKASPYDVLGVAPTASREEIMAAWRHLVKLYHPDFEQNRGSELKDLAERKTKLINWAKDEALGYCKSDEPISPHPSGERDKGNKQTIDDLGVYILNASDRKNLEIMLHESHNEKKPLHHLLLAGTGTYGKLVVHEIARYLESNYRLTSAASIESVGYISALLTNLEEGDILFIDDIHQLKQPIVDLLGPAMDNFRLELTVGEGKETRVVHIDLAPFTVVATTPKEEQISATLRARFAALAHLIALPTVWTTPA